MALLVKYMYFAPPPPSTSFSWYLKDFLEIVLKQMTYEPGTCDMYSNKQHYLFPRAIHTVK